MMLSQHQPIILCFHKLLNRLYCIFSTELLHIVTVFLLCDSANHADECQFQHDIPNTFVLLLYSSWYTTFQNLIMTSICWFSCLGILHLHTFRKQQIKYTAHYSLKCYSVDWKFAVLIP